MTLEGQRLLERGRSLYRAGEIDTSNPISSLDQAATKSHMRSLAVPPGPPTRSIGFSSFKNHGSGESKLLVAIQPDAALY